MLHRRDREGGWGGLTLTVWGSQIEGSKYCPTSPPAKGAPTSDTLSLATLQPTSRSKYALQEASYVSRLRSVSTASGCSYRVGQLPPDPTQLLLVVLASIA